jgi:hypothetical protein
MDSLEIIKAFGEKVGIGFDPGSDGSCAFEVDGLLVTISDLREIDAIALVGDLGEPPPERLDALYKVLLEANHLFGGTCGATISRDPKTGRFALCRVMPCVIADGDFFYAEVERFASTLETWVKIIRDFRDAPPDGAPPEAVSGGGAPPGLIAV